MLVHTYCGVHIANKLKKKTTRIFINIKRFQLSNVGFFENETFSSEKINFIPSHSLSFWVDKMWYGLFFKKIW